MAAYVNTAILLLNTLKTQLNMVYQIDHAMPHSKQKSAPHDAIAPRLRLNALLHRMGGLPALLMQISRYRGEEVNSQIAQGILVSLL